MAFRRTDCSKTKSKMKTLDSVASIYPILTQDKDAGAGFHCGHLVGRGALPSTLVVLGQRLQEQRTVGQDGVRSASHQVHLQGTKHTYEEFLQNEALKNSARLERMAHWSNLFDKAFYMEASVLTSSQLKWTLNKKCHETPNVQHLVVFDI